MKSLVLDRHGKHMGMKVEFHPGAEVDANAAQHWYAERSAIAVRAFLTKLIAYVDRIHSSIS